MTQRIRLISWWVGTVLLTAAGGLGCNDCAGSAGGSCACEVDEDCPQTMHCGGCWCLPDCATAADCTDPALPNCDPDTGTDSNANSRANCDPN